VADLPTLRMLTRPQADVRRQAEALCPQVAAAVAPRFGVEVVDMMGQIGSGSLPVERLPSAGLALAPVSPKGVGRALGELTTALRGLPAPVIGGASEDLLLLDLRCLGRDADLARQLPALQASLC